MPVKAGAVQQGFMTLNMYFLTGFLRWMYWTDWEEDELIDSRGRIEKAWMDGSHRQIFVTSNMLWPNGLTLDHSSSIMYWCDAYFDHIEKIYLNGSHRTVSKWVSQFFSSQTPPLCSSQCFTVTHTRVLLFTGGVQRERVESPVWDCALPELHILDGLHERLDIPSGFVI